LADFGNVNALSERLAPKSHRILGGDKVYISGISPRTTAVVELFDGYQKLQLIQLESI